jgi:hypothetical protein
MKIIVLTGTQNVGKSLAVRKVYSGLLDSYFYRQRVDIGVEARIGPKETNAVVTIDGTKIGIESFGDYPKKLRESLRRFRELECEIIICAAHPTFAYDVVSEVPNHDPEWIEKPGVSRRDLHDQDNDTAAQNILSRIVRFLRNQNRS